MRIIRNIRTRVQVTFGGVVSQAYSTDDLLVDAVVLQVFPIKRSAQNKLPSCGSLVWDPDSGDRVLIQGFGKMAPAVHNLCTGDVICAKGKVSYFRGQRFNVVEFLDNNSVSVQIDETTAQEPETEEEFVTAGV